MIQYSLICKNQHRFDAWFKSASVFDEQVAHEVVTCPICATCKVNKALMAPAVSLGERQRRVQGEQFLSVSTPSQASREPGNSEKSHTKVSLSAGHPDQAKLARALRTLRDQITSNADYVGDKFALEARKIHECEVEPHGIYGEATIEEAASLLEDGIEFMPLPTLPEEQN